MPTTAMRTKNGQWLSLGKQVAYQSPLGATCEPWAPNKSVVFTVTPPEIRVSNVKEIKEISPAFEFFDRVLRLILDDGTEIDPDEVIVTDQCYQSMVYEQPCSNARKVGDDDPGAK